MNNIIYALVDPRNDLVNYVGKSTIGIGRPLTHLLNSHNKFIREWVSELGKIHLSPSVIILEEFIELNILSEREVYWIKEYSKINTSLFNIAHKEESFKTSDFIILDNEIDLLKKIFSDVPKLIKSIRNISGLTQQELSILIGVNRSTLIEMESNGKGKIQTLHKMIEALNHIDKNRKRSKVKMYSKKNKNEA